MNERSGRGFKFGARVRACARRGFVTDSMLGKYMRAVKSATEDYWIGGNKFHFTRLVSVSS